MTVLLTACCTLATIEKVGALLSMWCRGTYWDEYLWLQLWCRGTYSIGIMSTYGYNCGAEVLIGIMSTYGYNCGAEG